MRRRAFMATAASSAAIISSRSWAANEIKIGSPMALSGPGALYGQPITRGAELAAGRDPVAPGAHRRTGRDHTGSTAAAPITRPRASRASSTAA